MERARSLKSVALSFQFPHARLAIFHVNVELAASFAVVSPVRASTTVAFFGSRIVRGPSLAAQRSAASCWPP